MVKRDLWHMTCDMWHVTHVGGNNSLKISAPKLLRCGMDLVLYILKKRITDLYMNQWINDKGVYRTAPATSGLLNIYIPSPSLGKNLKWLRQKQFSIWTAMNALKVAVKTKLQSILGRGEDLSAGKRCKQILVKSGNEKTT